MQFGSVIDPLGSVMSLFCEQIKFCGPVTLTHKDAAHYFVTSSEAAVLGIQAADVSVTRQNLSKPQQLPYRYGRAA